MSIKEIKASYKNSKLDKPAFIKEMHGIHAHLFQYAEALSETDVQKIEITPEGVFFKIKHRALSYEGPGLNFVVDPQDFRVTPIETFNFNTYEHDDFKMLARLFKDGQNFFDIGGNVGFHSLSMSQQFKKSKFFCFEPIPKTFGYLKRNKEINKIENVEIFNFGFSDRDSTLEFFYYPEGSGNASSKNLTDRSDAMKVQAKVTTLDKFINESKVKVDFIKCDVEGAELFVFEGGKETISKHRPIVFSEILRKWSQKFDYNPNQIFELFRSLDYKSYTVRGEDLVPFEKMNETTLETNFFFIPSENKTWLK